MEPILLLDPPTPYCTRIIRASYAMSAPTDIAYGARSTASGAGCSAAPLLPQQSPALSLSADDPDTRCPVLRNAMVLARGTGKRPLQRCRLGPIQLHCAALSVLFVPGTRMNVFDFAAGGVWCAILAWEMMCAVFGTEIGQVEMCDTRKRCAVCVCSVRCAVLRWGQCAVCGTEMGLEQLGARSQNIVNKVSRLPRDPS
eukprot:2586804-Rhodomonas_salina.2